MIRSGVTGALVLISRVLWKMEFMRGGILACGGGDGQESRKDWGEVVGRILLKGAASEGEKASRTGAKSGPQRLKRLRKKCLLKQKAYLRG
jgi:hypothetical protein